MSGAAVKTLHAIGLLAKPEGSYLGGGSLSTSTDGVQLAYDSPEGAPLDISEIFDGRRSVNPGGPMPLPYLKPGAREVRGTLPFQLKGFGAIYTGSNKPNLHNFLLAAGWVGTFSTGPAKWTYTRSVGPTGFTSLVAALICADENWPVTGIYTNWKWSAENGGPIKDEFDIVGLLGDPTDDASSAISIVYPTLDVDPPKAESMLITLGSFLLPTIRSVSYDGGRSIDNRRTDLTMAGAHSGFQPGTELAPRLKLRLDRTALVGTPFHTSGGLDVYKLRRDAVKHGIVVTRGLTQYNRGTLTWPVAQICAPIKAGGDQAGAYWDIELCPSGSTPIANDGETWLMD